MAQKRFHSLTSLRFFAAYLVLISHVVPLWFTAPRFSSIIHGIVPAASFAVPFFFTLSGFVLAYSESHVGARVFWWRRFTKVAPLYYLSLVLHAPVTMFFLNATATVLTATHLLAAIGMNATFLGAWLPQWLILNPPGWTLSAEAFFYLLFPAVTPLLARIPAQRLPWAMVVSFGIGALIQWAGDSLTPGKELPEFMRFSYSNPLAHLSEFIIGILLARLYFAKAMAWPFPPRQTLAFGVAGLAVLLCFESGFAVTTLRSFAGTPFYCLIIGGACGLERGWLSNPILVKLGEASYALYVLHWPLLDWASFGEAQAGWPRFGWPMGLAILIACPILSLFAFRYLETPVRRALAPRER